MVTVADEARGVDEPVIFDEVDGPTVRVVNEGIAALGDAVTLVGLEVCTADDRTLSVKPVTKVAQHDNPVVNYIAFAAGYRGKLWGSR